MTPEARSMETGNPSKIPGYNSPRVWSSGKGAEPLLGSIVGKWAEAPADVLTAVWAEPFHLPAGACKVFCTQQALPRPTKEATGKTFQGRVNGVLGKTPAGSLLSHLLFSQAPSLLPVFVPS